MTDEFSEDLVAAHNALEKAQQEAPLTVSYELRTALAAVERCMEKERETRE